MPKINITSNWLRFGAFLSPPASSLQFHWPLATDHNSPVPRSTPHAAGTSGSGRAQTLPRCLLPDTDSRFGKDLTGPDLDERSLSFSMAPNRATPTEKSIGLCSLATVGPQTILSWPDLLTASGSRRACRMHTSPNACSLLVVELEAGHLIGRSRRPGAG